MFSMSPKTLAERSGYLTHSSRKVPHDGLDLIEPVLLEKNPSKCELE